MAEAMVLGDLELDRVTACTIQEHRKLAVHAWPGGEGDLVQDLGAGAARLWVDGVAVGESAGDRLEQLRKAMQDGQPLDFSASAAVGSEIEQVLIAALHVHQPPGRVDYYEYRMELIRYVPPPPPPSAGFDVGALGDIAADVQGIAGEAMGTFTEALGTVNEALAAVEDVKNMVEDVMEGVAGAAIITELLEKAGKVITAWAG
ncbi:MAG TPA: DNA circularization N-terminal domain-containing protein [Symbiobacteriaceae bacterium]|nr:DNA circularization N-terminal domain-containing protein [Symbiobacteriaceae bacterium]